MNEKQWEKYQYNWWAMTQEHPELKQVEHPLAWQWVSAPDGWQDVALTKEDVEFATATGMPLSVAMKIIRSKQLSKET